MRLFKFYFAWIIIYPLPSWNISFDTHLRLALHIKTVLTNFSVSFSALAYQPEHTSTTLASWIVLNLTTTLQNIVSSTFWELIFIWHVYVACFASPTVHWTSIKNLIVSAYAVISKLSFTFSFIVIVMIPHARYCVTCSNILSDDKLAEQFHCLSNTVLLRLFIFSLSDVPTEIWSVWCANGNLVCLMCPLKSGSFAR